MKRLIVLLIGVLFVFTVPTSVSADIGFTGFARVTMDDVNIREEPSADSKRLDRLMEGQHVFVRKEAQDANGELWYHINYKPRNDRNKSGWIRGDMLLLSRDVFTDVVKIAVGQNHIAVLKKDGTVRAMGEQYQDGFNPDIIDWQGVTDIAAGTCTVVGVADHGGLLGLGNYWYSDFFAETTDATSIYMYVGGYMVLREDGSILVTLDINGKQYLPQNQGSAALPSKEKHGLYDLDALCVSRGELLDAYRQLGQNLGEWSEVKGAAKGDLHHVLLLQDGTVKAFGENYYGVCDVSNWTDIVQVACGEFTTVGLKSDGTVIAAGYNEYGGCDVSAWKNIVQVECAGRFTVGLTSEGQVLVAGEARFDYDANHDQIYAETHSIRISALDAARRLDAGY